MIKMQCTRAGCDWSVEFSKPLDAIQASQDHEDVCPALAEDRAQGQLRRRAAVMDWLRLLGIDGREVVDDYHCVVSRGLASPLTKLTYRAFTRPEKVPDQFVQQVPAWVPDERRKFLVERVGDFPSPPGWDDRARRWNASLYIAAGQGHVDRPIG